MRYEKPGWTGYEKPGFDWRNVVGWMIVHWRITLLALLIAAGALYNAVHVSESEHPRSGYYDTGETITTSDCRDQGGTVLDDVCYAP